MEFLDKENNKTKCGIYCIINQLTGDIYIGQTRQTFYKRFEHHRWKLRNGSHDNKHLQNAWNLYGKDNFIFIAIKIVEKDNIAILDELEIKYINIMKELNRCYNIIEGGNTRKQIEPMNERQKRLIGEKNRINMTGKKHSDKTKKLMSEVHKGKRTNVNVYKLNEDEIIQIKKLLVSGMKPVDVSRKLNIDYKLVNNILSNNCWNNIIVDGWEEFRANRKTYNRLTEKDHKEIYRLYIEKGLSKKQLADKYNRTDKMIAKIIEKYNTTN